MSWKKTIIFLCALWVLGCNSPSTDTESCGEGARCGPACGSRSYSPEDDHLTLDPDVWEHVSYDPIEVVKEMYGTWTGTYFGGKNTGEFDFTFVLKSAADSKDPAVINEYFVVRFPVCSPECTAADYEEFCFECAVMILIEFHAEINGTKVSYGEGEDNHQPVIFGNPSFVIPDNYSRRPYWGGGPYFSFTPNPTKFIGGVGIMMNEGKFYMFAGSPVGENKSANDWQEIKNIKHVTEF